MAALLVSLAVMSVLMTVALPVWRHQAQREKEAELVFRGEQYARAVALFRSRFGNSLPPSVDVLVQQKFLRKKYKDPITGQDFELVGGSQSAQGGQQPPGQRGGAQPRPAGQPTGSSGGPSLSPGQSAAGIIGVRSKSKDTSIRIYRGQTRYDQWPFVFTMVRRPGGATPAGTPGPGQPPGGRGPGGRGPGAGAPSQGPFVPGGRGRGVQPPPGGRGPGFPPPVVIR